MPRCRHAATITPGCRDPAPEPVDPARARGRLAALQPERQRVLGPDHPDTLTTRVQLAVFTGEAGNPVEARDQLAALLPAMERVLGPQNCSTLVIREGLDYWTRQAERRSG